MVAVITCEDTMAWRGFTTESKAFCGYQNKTAYRKVAWWWAYITNAAPKFLFYIARDWWRMRHVRRANKRA